MNFIPSNKIEFLPDGVPPKLLESCKEKGHRIEEEVFEHLGDDLKGVWYIMQYCLSCGKCEALKISEERFDSFMIVKARSLKI